MAYNFFINKNSTLPALRMEAINDGRHDFSKLNLALQSADVYFTMTDINNGIKKISNAKADVVFMESSNCEEKYVIEYKWKERDTKTPGIYKGEFKIVFDGNLVVDDFRFPKGELIVPISQELMIHIADGSIKR
jgi:hypothetical protein